MSSPLPHTESLVYMIQTKLQLEIPHSLRHDIETTLYNYGQEVASTYKEEKDYWKNMFFTWKEEKS